MEGRRTPPGVGRPRSSGVAIAVLLAVLAGSPGARAVDGPTLTVGDAWTYTTNTTLAEGFWLDGRVTFTVTGVASRSVEGVLVDVFVVATDGSGTAVGSLPTNTTPIPLTGTWRVTGEEWLERAGLKVVSSVVDLRANGTLRTEPFPQAFSMRFQNTTRFRILEDGWRFPLDVGDTGSVRARFNATEDVFVQWGLFTNTTVSQGAGIRTLTYALELRTNVSTPAGTFEAFRTNESWPDGSYDLLYFAPAVGNNVRTETYNESGVKLVTTELVAYRYQILEPRGFLGLGPVQWALVAALAAGGLLAAVLYVRRRARIRGARPGTENPPPPEQRG